MALTLSDDQAVQKRTWFDAQPWDKAPAALRRRLTVGEVEAAASALVKKDVLVTATASRLARPRWLPEPLRRSLG